MTIDQSLQRALQHHQAGELPQAETLYRQILAVEPNHPDALCLLGVLATQAGQPAAAIDLLRRADAGAPGSDRVKLATVEAYARLGDQLQSRGENAAAIESYHNALRLKHDFPEIWNNLGLSHAFAGQLDLAAAAYRQALSLRPTFAEAHSNLADVLRLQNKLVESAAEAREAIRLRPNYPQGLNNLGNALLQMGQINEAADAFAAALRCDPAMPEVHNNLGNALAALGRFAEALMAYQRAVELRPTFVEAMSNLGNMLSEMSRPQEAAEMLAAAISIKPLAEPYNNLSNALRETGQIKEAMEGFRTAVRIKPDFQAAWSNLLYTAQFDPSYDGRAILELHTSWAKQFAEPLTAAAPLHHPDRTRGRRLRIGYLSPDLRDHPAGWFMLPLLEHHDHEQFEIVCYADVLRPDFLTDRLRTHADEWHQTNVMNDAALADQIRRDRIDILVDLAVHSAWNRMLVVARKPAPVQVTYLGYPGTTGLAAVDWRLTDRFLDPPEEPRPFYTERPMYLETTYWCYPPPKDAPDVQSRPQGEPITFGCLNAFVKVSELALATWATVLAGVAGSRIIIQSAPGKHRDRVRDIFAAENVDASRVTFVERALMPDYFAHYHRIDIALDPFPYNGGTTTCDALWMGVPVVSLAGDIAVRRAGLSILSRAGLGDLVSSDQGSYTNIAAALAADRARLAELRSTLRERMRAAPLMDAPSFVRDLERCYRQMWAAV